jgi:hypothetical protein
MLPHAATLSNELNSYRLSKVAEQRLKVGDAVTYFLGSALQRSLLFCPAYVPRWCDSLTRGLISHTVQLLPCTTELLSSSSLYLQARKYISCFTSIMTIDYYITGFRRRRRYPITSWMIPPKLCRTTPDFYLRPPLLILISVPRQVIPLN